MTNHDETAGRLDFGSLRHAIELRDQEAVLGFYAEDARVRVMYDVASQGLVFDFRGRARIAGYLRAIFDGDVVRRVGDGVASEGRIITFRETCEYADGARVVVQTTLEVGDGGEIIGQEDSVVSEEPGGAGEGSEAMV
jgi:hypothetical protein